MILVKSDVDEVLKRVCLIYNNEENVIEYQMVFNSKGYRFIVNKHRSGVLKKGKRQIWRLPFLLVRGCFFDKNLLQ